MQGFPAVLCRICVITAPDGRRSRTCGGWQEAGRVEGPQAGGRMYGGGSGKTGGPSGGRGKGDASPFSAAFPKPPPTRKIGPPPFWKSGSKNITRRWETLKECFKKLRIAFQGHLLYAGDRTVGAMEGRLLCAAAGAKERAGGRYLFRTPMRAGSLLPHTVWCRCCVWERREGGTVLWVDIWGKGSVWPEPLSTGCKSRIPLHCCLPPIISGGL